MNRRWLVHAVSACLLLLLLPATSIAEEILVLAPRGGAYRAGQEVQVSWKQPPSRSEPVVIQLVGRKGRPVHALGRVMPSQRGLKVRIPRDAAAGRYTIRVVQGVHRGSSGTFRVTRPRGPARLVPTEATGAVRATIRPRQETYHAGESVEIVLSSGRAADSRDLTVRLWSPVEGRPPSVLARATRSTNGVIPVTIPVGLIPGTHWITVHVAGASNPLTRTIDFAVGWGARGGPPPGRTEHAVVPQVTFVDETHRALAVRNGVAQVEPDLVRGRRVFLLVRVDRIGPRQPLETCRPGIRVSYRRNDSPGTVHNAGGRAFTLRELSGDALHHGVLEARIPFEIGATMPLGSEISGTAVLARVGNHACDVNPENNATSFRLQVADDSVGAVDLDMAWVGGLRLSESGNRYHMRATIRLLARGAGARRFNVLVRWSFKGRRARDTEWIPLDGHNTQGQASVSGVNGETPVFKEIHAYMSKGPPNNWDSLCPFYEGVHGHLGVVVDPLGGVEDTTPGNNSVSRTWD